MAAWFIVRARVEDALLKDAFNRWYQDEHLPDALKAFGARRAWRGWSTADPSVHQAFYEFDDLARAQTIQRSDALRGLIAEFDRVWGNKVTRSRDFFDVIQSLGD